ncbi:hypothetical protein [Streptomyces sp. NPDC051577]|uniref:hypothetical protein n=1 Tax=Streptomyces sp. NPDC051577 TaxID=3155166 RepID=UPI00341E0762
MEEVVLRLKELLFQSIANVAVLSVDVNIEIVRIDAKCTTTGAACPECGAWSAHVHCSYLRFPADVPGEGLYCDVESGGSGAGTSCARAGPLWSRYPA